LPPGRIAAQAAGPQKRQAGAAVPKATRGACVSHVSVAIFMDPEIRHVMLVVAVTASLIPKSALRVKAHSAPNSETTTAHCLSASHLSLTARLTTQHARHHAAKHLQRASSLLRTTTRTDMPFQEGDHQRRPLWRSTTQYDQRRTAAQQMPPDSEGRDTQPTSLPGPSRHLSSLQDSAPDSRFLKKTPA
jgi:hypothetical protein